MTSDENSVFTNFHEFFIMTYKKYWIFAIFYFFGEFLIQVGQETDRIRTECKFREKLELNDRHVITNSLWLISNIEFWQFSDLLCEFLTTVGHETDILWTDCKSLENLETKDRHVMTNPLWLISNMRFWLFRPFWGQFLTLSGHDMHRLWIVRKFGIVWWATRLMGIESYAYYVYLAVFQIYDPKMTLFDPLDDLGRP